MAKVLRYSTEVASSQPLPPNAVLPGWKLQGDECGEAAGLFLQAPDDFEVVDAVLHGFAYAEHHGGGGAHAERVRGAMHADPIFGAAFEPGDAVTNLVVEDLGASAGDGIEAGVAQAQDGIAQAKLAVFRDGEDLTGAEAMQPDVGEALLDAGEEAFEPVDLEVGVDAALHEDAGASHLFGLADLIVDLVELEDVALGGELAFERPVEGAEGAVLGAEVGVIDVAIDDVADHALGMKASANRVSLHPDTDEIVTREAIQRLFPADSHSS